jgi:hypothetical protein
MVFVYEELFSIEENPMNKIFYFLMVGLFLTAFQVVEVEAQRGDSVDTRDTRGDDGRATDAELDARYGTDRGAPVDTRGDGGRATDAELDARYGTDRGAPVDTRGDGGRATDAELDARYGTDRGAPVDTRPAPVDTRVREDTPPAPVDTRVAAPSEDTRGGGLSKSEMIQECKKTYGKKKKNKAAKQACIAAAKGQ